MTDETVNLPPPRPRSWSQLSAYNRCGYAYRLKYVDRVQRKPAWWSIGGSAVHAATEAFDKSGEYPKFPRFLQAEVDRARADSPDHTDDTHWFAGGRANARQDGEWWDANGQQMVDNWIEWQQSNPDYKIVDVELDMQFTLPNGGPIRAITDRTAFHNPTKAFGVIDIKAGARTPDSPQQLGIYAQAVQQVCGIRPAWGSYYMARKGELTMPVSLSNFDTGYWDFHFTTLNVGIENEVFLPKPGQNCRTCDVAHACPFSV